MSKKRILYFIIAILVIFAGGFMFVYAEIDDSPGGQLIGVLVVIGGIISVIKNKKKTSNLDI